MKGIKNNIVVGGYKFCTSGIDNELVNFKLIPNIRYNFRKFGFFVNENAIPILDFSKHSIKFYIDDELIFPKMEYISGVYNNSFYLISSIWNKKLYDINLLNIVVEQEKTFKIIENDGAADYFNETAYTLLGDYEEI